MTRSANIACASHLAVLHTYTPLRPLALCVPVANLPELQKRLHMSLAYTETLGDCTYDHYDVWSVRGRS